MKIQALSYRLAEFKKAKQAPNPLTLFRSQFRQPSWRAGDYPYPDTPKRIGLGGNGNRHRPEGRYATDLYFAYGDKPTGLRGPTEAHKVLTRLGHTGWYADSDLQVTYVGVAYQLPAKDRQERWLAGYLNTEAENVTLDIGGTCIYDSKEEAARAADSFAEREAEKARDYDAQESARFDIAEAREEIHKINKRFRTLAAETRGHRFTPAICEALKEKLQELLADRRAQFKTIKEREANYWSAVPNL